MIIAKLSSSSSGAELALFPTNPTTLTPPTNTQPPVRESFFSQLRLPKVRIVKQSRQPQYKLTKKKQAGMLAQAGHAFQ